MFHGKKIVVVTPTHIAARGIERTVVEIPRIVGDEVVVTDEIRARLTRCDPRGQRRDASAPSPGAVFSPALPLAQG